MSTIINARSPYYIKLEPSNPLDVLSYANVNLYIYSGSFTTDKPVSATYTLNEKTFLNTNYTILEVSELIRDYLYTEYFTLAIDGVWVEIDYSLYDSSDVLLNSGNLDYLAFDGFGYLNEGANPRQSTDPTNESHTPMVLQTNQTVYFVKGRDIRIPLFVEPQPTATSNISLGVWNDVDLYWEAVNVSWEYVNIPIPIPNSNISTEKITYLIIQSDYVETGDTVTIQSNSGNNQTITIKFIEYCEPKFEPYRIIFYNKFGALQDIWTTKKSVISTSVTDESYNSNVMDFTSSPSYSIYKHTKKRFNVKSNQSILLNTDFIIEELNEPIEQMLMSEQAWIENSIETIPVILKSKSLTRKTRVNDKLIQYNFEFNYAFDTIQNIR